MTSKTPPVTRSELVQVLRERLSVSAKDANRIIESALESITDVLAERGSVSLAGLGRFQVKLTPARPGRNPKTGVPAEVPMHWRPTFTMSRSLRDRLMEYGSTRLLLNKAPRPPRSAAARKKGEGGPGPEPGPDSGAGQE
jgi:nucleoid DNA-binding protein